MTNSLRLRFAMSMITLTTGITIATAYENCKTIVTFNTALVPFVPNADVRRPSIIKALKASPADVICLQEVWFEKDMIPILHRLKQAFPHHFSAIHVSSDVLRPRDPTCADGERVRIKDTSCSAEDVTSLFTGLAQCGCSDLPGRLQLLCIISRCPYVLRNDSVNPHCISCVVFEAARYPNVEEALRGCATSGDKDNRLNPPGLVLLSKEKLSNVSYMRIFPFSRMILERGYIEATLTDGKRVVCTHLSSSSLSVYLEYDEDIPYTSYEEQNRAEIEILGNAIAGHEHVLVGDINASPIVSGQSDPEKNLAGDMVENYDLLVEMFGYDPSPYYAHDGRCTFCNNNPLTSGAPNNVIDVVMVVNGSSLVVPSAGRVFDTDAYSTRGPLSDHFGVQARVCEN